MAVLALLAVLLGRRRCLPYLPARPARGTLMPTIGLLPHQLYVAERPDGHTLDGMPGDCYRVCVAILLDVNPTTLPHFVMHKRTWWDLTRRTVRQITDGELDMSYSIPSPWPLYGDVPEVHPTQRYAIASGRSPRGAFNHCIVIDSVTGDFVHDPHPSGAGLTGDYTGIDYLVPAYDPPPAEPIALPPARLLEQVS